MSMAGIAGWKSALQGGAPVELPDFRRESARKRYEDDDWSPFAEDVGPGQPPPSVTGMNPPAARQIRFARKVWKEIGHDEL
jgi:hypothetical protein